MLAAFGALALALSAAVPAGAQTTVSHVTPPVNSPTAPTTVPPASSPSAAPAPPQLATEGTLIGSLVSNDGIPTNTNSYTTGVTITGVRRGTGDTFEAKSDPATGGFFRVDNLQPGVYDITVPASYLGSTPYSAEQINDVVVTAGQHTTLNVTVYPGTRPLTTGVPATISVPVAQQLAQNAQTIHELELQLDAMRLQLQQLTAQVAALQPRTAAR